MTQDSNRWEPAPPPGPTTSSSRSGAPSPPPSSPSRTRAGDGPVATGDDVDHCTRLVRRHDPDRYLSTLFAPAELRPALLGLHAFNVELGLVRESVTDPALGELRLQWWRETVTGLFRGNVAGGPVVRALSDAVALGRLPEPGLLDMIEARTLDLDDGPAASLEELEGHLARTSSALIVMAGSVLCRGEGTDCAEAAGPAGVAFGLAGLLRSLAFHSAHGRCRLPADLMERFGVTVEDLRGGGSVEGLPFLAGHLCTHADGRLREARDRLPAVPARAIPAFLPVCLVDVYLDAVRALGPDLARRPPAVGRMRRQWRLLRFALRGRF